MDTPTTKEILLLSKHPTIIISAMNISKQSMLLLDKKLLHDRKSEHAEVQETVLNTTFISRLILTKLLSTPTEMLMHIMPIHTPSIPCIIFHLFHPHPLSSICPSILRNKKLSGNSTKRVSSNDTKDMSIQIIRSADTRWRS